MTEEGATPPDDRVVEQRGLWFEELEPGVRYLHRPGRTVTEADNVLFSTLTMNGQSLHLDAAWSQAQPFGQRLMNSMFTLATMVGSSVGQLTQGTTVANLGFSEISFPHPLFHGDTMYSESTVIEKRLSKSRPGQGVVTFEHLARNQDGELVARAVRSALMWCAPRAEARSTPTPGSPSSTSSRRRSSASSPRTSGANVSTWLSTTTMEAWCPTSRCR